MSSFAPFGQIIRFAGVGVTCSVMYFVLATGLNSLLGLDTISASFLAYLLSAIFGYTAHRRVTFVSDGAVHQEVTRFFAATGVGVTISLIVPMMLHNHTPVLSFFMVFLIVPACSFVMMKFFVFRT
ncbi:GtrA family protein [uncultured Shimia sp.]|uniref:GtrA family protein n=1 Tax=uncultured Shimia sp. TaxID=573152 RepID=UPI0026388437|nr:GtrA family protein [uncultured Shimia sp.]